MVLIKICQVLSSSINHFNFFFAICAPLGRLAFLLQYIWNFVNSSIKKKAYQTNLQNEEGLICLKKFKNICFQEELKIWS